MKDKFCLPIIVENTNEVLRTIKEAENNYRNFEIWVDYLDDIENIQKIIDEHNQKLIFVFRRKGGEQTRLNTEKINGIIDGLILGESAIDLDISENKEQLVHLKNSDRQLNLICSFHDYDKTPDKSELKAIINKMQQYSPDVVKISTFCSSKQDALRLLELQQELVNEDKKHIVLGMGKNGLITRIFATLWGNELAFVPENSEEKSAEGQITREKFEKIIKEITDK